MTQPTTKETLKMKTYKIVFSSVTYFALRVKAQNKDAAIDRALEKFNELDQEYLYSTDPEFHEVTEERRLTQC